MKTTGIFLILFLMVSLAYADMIKQSRYPIRKGDVLVYERTYEVHDDKGNILVYNSEGNVPERIKRTVTEKKVIIDKVDKGLKYGFLLKIGLQWGCDREGERSKDDHSYCSYVRSQENVVVPAGVFEGCFEVVYATNPDTTIEWYCPGVGVVKSEYVHHGTLINELIVLKKISWN